MKKKFIIAIIAVAAFLMVMPVYGQRRPSSGSSGIQIKLASMVPEKSDWGQLVNKLAAEWSRVTNGEVKLTVFADGTQGSEDEVLRKLRGGDALQAAIFTSVGINKIVPEVLTLSYPFMIRSDAEFDEVFRNVKPEIEAKINSQNNLYSLALVKAGWVKIFSRNPVFVPADLKRQKLASINTEPELAQAFRSMGYQVTPIDSNQILFSLSRGSIDAIYMSPIFAAVQQYFDVAKNMASINISPFLGGIILNKQAWESIPAKYRDELVTVTNRIAREMEASLLRLETQSVRTMKSYGLTENQLSSQQQMEWENDSLRAVSVLLSGGTFDRAMYNRINGILNVYRSTH
jgi:TRAP-type C4-dicarboxylate transport system substrate-binding protein